MWRSLLCRRAALSAGLSQPRAPHRTPRLHRLCTAHRAPMSNCCRRPPACRTLPAIPALAIPWEILSATLLLPELVATPLRFCCQVVSGRPAWCALAFHNRTSLHMHVSLVSNVPFPWAPYPHLPPKTCRPSCLLLRPSACLPACSYRFCTMLCFATLLPNARACHTISPLNSGCCCPATCSAAPPLLSAVATLQRQRQRAQWVLALDAISLQSPRRSSWCNLVVGAGDTPLQPSEICISVAPVVHTRRPPRRWAHPQHDTHACSCKVVALKRIVQTRAWT